MLKPHDPPPRKRRLRKQGQRQPRSPIYFDMLELRSRMLHGSADDPLARMDWWAEVWRGHVAAARSKAQSVRHNNILPYGLWHVIARKTVPTSVEQEEWEASDRPGDAQIGVVVVRWEGIAPWWTHASAHAWSTHYRRIIESTFDDIPASDLQQVHQYRPMMPPPTVIHCLTTEQRKLIPTRGAHHLHM